MGEKAVRGATDASTRQRQLRSCSPGRPRICHYYRERNTLMNRLLGMLMLLLVASGCATQQKVTEIPKDGMENPPGLPFRVLAPYTLRVFAKDKKTGDYHEVHVQWLDLPDQDRLFAVTVNSELFSNHTMQLNFKDDS